jgi:hypothetical protein
MFLCCVLVFVAVWQGWIGFGLNNPGTEFQKDLEDLRNTYERVAVDRNELNRLLVLVAGKMESFPDLDQTTHFVLGSGYARLAEITPSIEEARGYWVLAQKHFELVDREPYRLNPANPDGSKLAYRANKARAAVGLPEDTPPNVIAEIIELLGNNPPFGDDAGEAMRLRADLAMRMTPPDLITAKESLKRYVTSGLTTPPISRDRAYLLLADIHFRCRELEAAREDLSHITADSPGEIRIAKAALMGRVNMAEGNFAAATREWEAVCGMTNVSQSHRTVATFQLGICKLNTHDQDAATKLFEEAVKAADCPETVAAAIQLADLYLRSNDAGKRHASTDLLIRAMKDVKSSQDVLNNPNLNASDVRVTYELAISTLTTDEAYEGALKIIAAYKPVEVAGWEREKRAKVLEAWAISLRDNKQDYKPKALEAAKAYVFASVKWMKLTDDSFKAFRTTLKVPETVLKKIRPFKNKDWLPEDLAEAITKSLTEEEVKTYQDLILGQAVPFPPATTRADTLRRAAAMFSLGGEPNDAAETLKMAAKLPELPEQVLGSVWIELADALIKAKRPTKEVWDAFNKAMSEGGPLSTKIRYTIARHFKDTRVKELSALACELYKQICKQTNISQAEQEYQEHAYLDLSDEYVRNNDFSEAEHYLRSQLSAYPTGPDAPFGRLLLGVCLLQIASVPPPTGPEPSKATALRDEALRLFRTIVADADTKQKEHKLSEHEAWVQKQAAIRILLCYLQTNNPNDLLRESADLVERCRGTVEELIIWSLVYHAFKQKGDSVRALETRDKMKELFDRLPASAFTADRGVGEYSRVYWEKTWFTPEK